MDNRATITRSIRTPIQLKDRRRVTFYAAVFGVVETVSDDGATFYREEILPTAFDRYLATDGEVIANVDHDPGRTLARRSTGELLLQPDPFGLFTSYWIPETPLGAEVLRRVEAGELDGASFRFRPVQDIDQDGVIQRSAVILEDVCLTANPAYSATIGEVRLRTGAASKVMAQRLKFVSTKMRLGRLHIFTNQEAYGIQSK